MFASFDAVFQIYAADDAVEIVKAISPDKVPPNEQEKESDQVALESQDQESPPAILIPHAPPLPPGKPQKKNIKFVHIQKLY